MFHAYSWYCSFSFPWLWSPTTTAISGSTHCTNPPSLQSIKKNYHRTDDHAAGRAQREKKSTFVLSFVLCAREMQCMIALRDREERPIIPSNALKALQQNSRGSRRINEDGENKIRLVHCVFSLYNCSAIRLYS